DAAQLVRLLLRSLVVDDQAYSPVPIHHLGGRVGHDGDAVAADVHPVDLTAVNVISEDHGATILRPGRGKARNRAETFKVAVAVLEVGPLNVPAHGHTSSRASENAKSVLRSCGEPGASWPDEDAEA